jgi:hypothetical protein
MCGKKTKKWLEKVVVVAWEKESTGNSRPARSSVFSTWSSCSIQHMQRLKYLLGPITLIHSFLASTRTKLQRMTLVVSPIPPIGSCWCVVPVRTTLTWVWPHGSLYKLILRSIVCHTQVSGDSFSSVGEDTVSNINLDFVNLAGRELLILLHSSLNY